MNRGTRILLFLCSSIAAFVIYSKLPKPNEFEQRLAATLPAGSKILQVDAVELPDPNPIQVFLVKYSLTKDCVTCSHACFLVRDNAITPFYAKWEIPLEKPAFAAGVCEGIGENYCQNFLAGTPFLNTMFKTFFQDLTMGEQPKFQECLTSDLKARVRLLNPRN